jgi:hypothetical protein
MDLFEIHTTCQKVTFVKKILNDFQEKAGQGAPWLYVQVDSDQLQAKEQSYVMRSAEPVHNPIPLPRQVPSQTKCGM